MTTFGVLSFEQNDDARRAESLPIITVVEELAEYFSASRLRPLAGAFDARMMLEWATGAARPSPDQEQRLRVLLYMVWRIRSRHFLLDPWDWFRKPRSDLGGESPAEVLQFDRNDTPHYAELAVLEAVDAELGELSE